MLNEEQMNEIHQSRSDFKQTLRPVSPGAEALLFRPKPVLDHGFVRLIDYMGNDEAIVQAARVSYGSGTKHGSSDEGLIRYLMRHYHTTPFEHCSAKFHIKLPIFVARQFIRHRTASVNEYSARYSILDREFYIPESKELAKQSTINNQGRGENLDELSAYQARQILIDAVNEAYGDYELLHNADEYTDKEGFKLKGLGVARETARMVLPTNIYTQWYWKIDLHNLFHFLRLRADSHAQYEIRVYADTILDMVKHWVPLAAKAFEDYRMNAVNFSAQEMELLRDLLENPENPRTDTGLSNREYAEFLKKIKG